MPADNAHKILDIYAYFKGETGHVLVSNHFLAIGRNHAWSPADLQDGIEDAHRRGWVEPAERGWRLTQAGFDETTKLLQV